VANRTVVRIDKLGEVIASAERLGVDVTVRIPKHEDRPHREPVSVCATGFLCRA
jgi:hypothetical protein